MLNQLPDGFDIGVDWAAMKESQPLIPADWFLGGQHIGTGKIVMNRINMAPMSHHFFCNRCGDVWARIITRPPFRHHTTHENCPRCGFGYIGLATDDVMTHAPYGALLHMVKMCLRNPDAAPIHLERWKCYGLRPAIGG